jgi:hypothetical protein
MDGYQTAGKSKEYSICISLIIQDYSPDLDQFVGLFLRQHYVHHFSIPKQIITAEAIDRADLELHRVIAVQKKVIVRSVRNVVSAGITYGYRGICTGVGQSV